MKLEECLFLFLQTYKLYIQKVTAEYETKVCNFVRNSPVNSITEQSVLHIIFSAFHHGCSYVAPRTIDLRRCTPEIHKNIDRKEI